MNDNIKILQLSYGNYVSADDYFKLQSNWNSLREWLMQLKNSYMETDNIFDDAKFRILLSVLDKMNKLESSDIIEQ